MLQFLKSFIVNFKHLTKKLGHFFEYGWGKFKFRKNFLKRESPTLIHFPVLVAAYIYFQE